MSIAVAFTDTSRPGPSGQITAWAWDFGDGGTSTTRNPVHNYATAGNYSVTLTVTGSGNDGTSATTRSITVPATGSLRASFTSVTTALSVAFTDTSTPGPSGPITGWAWAFGDGGTSTSQNPSHTYTAGTYIVTLTVTGTSPDGTSVATATVHPTSAGGTIYFNGLATRMTNIEFHEVVSGGNVGPSAATFNKQYYSNQTPAIWDGMTFIGDDISLFADGHYTQVFKVETPIGDQNAWQPPGLFLSQQKGAAQVTKRRSNDLGNWNWYAMATKVHAWSGAPSALQWFDFCSLAYQTSSGDQFAFRLAYNAAAPNQLSYLVQGNVGYANNPSGFALGDHYWTQLVLPLTFDQWDEWVFGIKGATDTTGEVQIWHRAGGSWTKLVQKSSWPTYLWGTTSYGTFAADGSNWGTVIDKIGSYYGRYPGGTTETVYETGIARCSDLATAQSMFP